MLFTILIVLQSVLSYFVHLYLPKAFYFFLFNVTVVNLFVAICFHCYSSRKTPKPPSTKTKLIEIQPEEVKEERFDPVPFTPLPAHPPPAASSSANASPLSLRFDRQLPVLIQGEKLKKFSKNASPKEVLVRYNPDSKAITWQSKKEKQICISDIQEIRTGLDFFVVINNSPYDCGYFLHRS